MGRHIAKHNSKLLKNASGQEENEPGCNCQQPDNCPLPGMCQTDKLVYQSTATSATTKETYIGLTAPPFKDRWGNHKSDFKLEHRRHATTLSTHMWSLRDQGITPKLEWKIMARAAPFSPVTNTCNLCTSEKFHIIFKPELCSLNSRNELFAHCRHKTGLLLVKPSRKRKIG